MNKLFLKSGLGALGAVIGLMSVTGMAQDVDSLERKLRELNIMNNIFEAALETENQSGFRVRQARRPDSMYLAGQGMVFSFRMLTNQPVRVIGQNFAEGWQEYMNEMMEVTRRSLERVEASFPDLDLDFDNDFDFDFDSNSAYIIRGQQLPQQPQQGVFFMGGNRGPEREAMQEMEEAMRETQEEVRERQREIRNLQRELRDNGADVSRIETRISELEGSIEEQMARIADQQQAYEVFVTDLEAVRLEQQLAQVNETSDQIIATLCDYGATLRSLGSGEHVTIILEGVSDDTDQVYVFDYADINDCRDADTLKQGAVSYQLTSR